jgi:RNA recognition motif-containing protein
MPSRYAFVRYYNKDDADRAALEMHGKRYGENIITVDDANLQQSFFTQDTGTGSMTAYFVNCTYCSLYVDLYRRIYHKSNV